jgi:hypothetical protein
MEYLGIFSWNHMHINPQSGQIRNLWFVAIDHKIPRLNGFWKLTNCVVCDLGQSLIQENWAKNIKSAWNVCSYLDLWLWHAEGEGEFRPFGAGEVLGLLEGLLQGENLLSTKGGSRVLFLVVLAVVTWRPTALMLLLLLLLLTTLLVLLPAPNGRCWQQSERNFLDTPLWRHTIFTHITVVRERKVRKTII